MNSCRPFFCAVYRISLLRSSVFNVQLGEAISILIGITIRFCTICQKCHKIPFLLKSIFPLYTTVCFLTVYVLFLYSENNKPNLYIVHRHYLNIYLIPTLSLPHGDVFVGSRLKLFDQTVNNF